MMARSKSKTRAALARQTRASQGVDPSLQTERELEVRTSRRALKMFDALTVAGLKAAKPFIEDAPASGKLTAELSKAFRRVDGAENVNTWLRSIFEKGDEIHKRDFRKAINQQIGVDISDLLKDKEAARRVTKSVNDSANLIKSLDRDLVADIKKTILEGLSKGLDETSLKKLVLSRSNVPKWRAKLIARDQTSKLFGALSQQRQEDVGVKNYRWVTSRDERVRDEHRKLGGRVFSWSRGTPEGHPGDPVNCRCTAAPVIPAELAKVLRAA